MGLFGKRIEGKTAEEWYKLGLKSKNPEEEVGYYTKCLELNPKDANAWYFKAFTLSELGRYEEAIRCYDKALGCTPVSIQLVKKQYLKLSTFDTFTPPLSISLSFSFSKSMGERYPMVECSLFLLYTSFNASSV